MTFSMSQAFEDFSQLDNAMPLNTVEVEGIYPIPSASSDIQDCEWVPVAEFGLIIEESGTARYTEGEPLKEQSVSSTTNQLRKRTGNWFGVYRDQYGRFAVFNDFFGYRSVFYAFHGTKIIISSSFNAVASRLKQLGQQPELDWRTIGPHLATNTNLFRTRTSSTTFNKAVKTLWHDHVILVSREGSTVFHSPVPEPPSSSSYEDLVRAGIERASSTLDSLGQTGLPSVLSLSGGKDSRTVLALMLANGKNLPQITTRDPRTVAAGMQRDVFQKDFDLALKLATRYGLSWADQAHYSSQRLTFPETISRWQKYRSNNSFEITPASNITGPLETPIISVMGMGGELYRSYLGGEYRKNQRVWWQQANSSGNSRTDGISLLFDRLVKMWSIPTEYYEAMRSSFVRAYLFPGTSNAIEALDAGYASYRNPAHAGAFDFNRSANKITYYPLSQPEFLWASRRLSPEDQQDGKLLFDIMNAIDPSLLALDFASPPWPTRFTATRSSFDWGVVNSSRKLNSFDSITTPAKQLNAHLPMMNTTEFHRLARERTIDNIAFALDAGDFLAQTYNEGFGERVARTLQASGSPMLAMLGKTESIRNALVPGDYPVRTLQVNADSPVTASVTMAPTNRRNGSYNARAILDFVNTFDLSGVTAEASLESNDVFSIKVEGVPEGYEVAVYFYRNAERAEIEWYRAAENGSITFSFDASEKGVYRSTVFLKAKHLPEPSRTIDTAEFGQAE